MSTHQTDISGNQTQTPKTSPPTEPKQDKTTILLPPTCNRCKRKGHYSIVCKAKTDKYGYEIESDEEYNSE